MDTVKIPGPDHPITVKAHPGRLQALYQGHVIADSASALMLKEASYNPVAYFPREDVAMEFLGRTTLDTYCPYKGHAAYYTIDRDAVISENAAWTYETPHPAMEVITGRLAFYPNIVEIVEVGASPATPEAAILHTDAGDGKSQAAAWPVTAPNNSANAG
jgi:uncharacterized protein (DUF427 family)